MSECKIYSELITALAADELDKNTAVEVRAHIDVCPKCALAYKTALQVEEAFSADVHSIPLGFSKSVALRISDIAEQKRVLSYKKLELWWLVPWIAASIAICAVITGILAPKIPSYTQWLPRIMANPISWIAAFTVVLGAIVTSLFLAMAGFLAYRTRK